MNKKRNLASRLWAIQVSVQAFSPMLITGILFITTVNAWTFFAFDYAMLNLFIAVFAVGFVIYFCVEAKLRDMYLHGSERVAWFALIVAVGLTTIFYVGDWVKPLVLQNPQWCRVSQKVIGTTETGGSYKLELNGRGNKSKFKFTSGSLLCRLGENFDGTTISLNPLRIGWQNQYKEWPAASPDVLRREITKAGFSERELAALTDDIWPILHQARIGVPLTSDTSGVEPVEDAPLHDAEFEVGGVIWLFVMAFLFLVTGQLTLTKPVHKILK